MPAIKVYSSFALRLGPGEAVREFGLGEHELSAEELAHWFIQGCIKEGRAVELPGKGTATGSGKGKIPAAAKTPRPSGRSAKQNNDTRG